MDEGLDVTADTPGSELRRARKGAGLSLAQMAQRVGYTKPYLSQLETGAATVNRRHIESYEQALGARIGEERHTVGTTDVDLLRQSADVVTAIGLRQGGVHAVDMASAQWDWTQNLLSRSMSETVRVEVSRQAARLADRYAWSSADAGNRNRAGKLYRKGLQLAEGKDLHALLRVDLANFQMAHGQPRTALTTLEGLAGLDPVLEFTTHGARARANGKLGDWDGCLRHVGKADDTWSAVDLEDLPDTHRPFASGHEAHVHQEAGKALYELALINRRAVPMAMDRLHQAIRLFGPERARAVSRCEQRVRTLTA